MPVDEGEQLNQNMFLITKLSKTKSRIHLKNNYKKILINFLVSGSTINNELKLKKHEEKFKTLKWKPF